MQRTLYYLSISLFVVGVGLLVAAFLQAFTSIAIFDDAPWLVGVALATIGGLMASGYRQKSRSN